MKKLLFLALLVALVGNTTAQRIPIVNGWRYVSTYPQLVAQFNFSWTANSVASWVNVVGDPYSAILTATDNRSGSSIGVSTIATGATYWNWNGSAAAGLVTNSTANGSFPAAVGSGYFFHMSTTPPTNGNMKITGLAVAGTYTIEILTLRPTVTDNRTTTINIIDSLSTWGSTYNSAPSTLAGTVVTYTGIKAKTNGEIWIKVSAGSGMTYGYINAIRITRTA